MVDLEEFQEGKTYPKEAQYAVRYGYYYRKEAEKHENGHLHACLGQSSSVLLWIASAVIGGVVYDVLKAAVKKLYQKMVTDKRIIDKTTRDILADESKLDEFYTFVLEFQEHRVTANEKQIRYIREEIVADYVGNEADVIYEKEKRPPTIEEHKVIIRQAFMLADELIEEHKDE